MKKVNVIKLSKSSQNYLLGGGGTVCDGTCRVSNCQCSTAWYDLFGYAWTNSDASYETNSSLTNGIVTNAGMYGY